MGRRGDFWLLKNGFVRMHVREKKGNNKKGSGN